MNDGKAKEQKDGFELEFDLDEPPQRSGVQSAFRNFGKTGCRKTL